VRGCSIIWILIVLNVFPMCSQFVCTFVLFWGMGGEGAGLFDYLDSNRSQCVPNVFPICILGNAQDAVDLMCEVAISIVGKE